MILYRKPSLRIHSFVLLALLGTGNGWCQLPSAEGGQTPAQTVQTPGQVGTDSRDPNVYIGQQPSPRSFARKFTANFLLDQKDIWTSPFRIDKSSAKWWIFAGVGTFSLIAADHEIAQALPQNGPVVNFGKQASRAGEWYTVFPVAAGFYASGLVTHDKKLIETGALSLEALASADVVTIGLKAAVRRERPNEGDHGGHFEKGGSSFPSGHSTQAWALATVLADEYGNHKWVPYVSYGYATLVSTSRLLAQDHFSSDVFVGGAIGFFIGRYVVRTQRVHHNHLTGIPSKLLSAAVTPSFSPVQKSVALTWTN